MSEYGLSHPGQFQCGASTTQPFPSNHYTGQCSTTLEGEGGSELWHCTCFLLPLSVFIISSSNPCARVRSLSKLAQGLIGSYRRIQRCFHFPQNQRWRPGGQRRGGGNLRLILQRAGSALNLDGHGLIRFSLTNLEQMGLSPVSWCWCESLKTPAADWRRLSCLGLTSEPLSVL